MNIPSSLVLWCSAVVATASLGCGERFEEGSGGSSAGGAGAGTTTPTGSGGSAGSGGDVGTGGYGGGSAPPQCGAKNLRGVPMFYTTLDDGPALAVPEYGDGSSVHAPGAPPFVPALDGNGVAFSEPTHFIRWDQVGSEANINLQHGTLDFCFRPSFNTADGEIHIIFRAETPGGRLQLRKAGVDSANHLEVMATATAGALTETAFAPSDFSLQTGVWVRLTVSWDFTVAADVRQVHLWADGGEIPPTTLSQPATGPFLMDLALMGQPFYLGSTAGLPSADGTIDEFVIYGTAVSP